MKNPTIQPPSRLILAGPGAGKTHNMVSEILAALNDLAPHRHLAAITFTNSAANTIRERLAKHVAPRRNVFVGTTHGFVNRYVLQPFATLFDELPSERMFGAIDVLEIATQGGKKKLAAGMQLNGAVSRITARLLAKGVVPYDAMLAIAGRLMKDRNVRERVSFRLQFLFVDEFQDTDSRQFQIFESLRKLKKTTFFAVGDPEQYVTGFTYSQRRQKAPEFEKIPFFQLRAATRPEELPINRRANGELVEFTNQFRDDLSQVAETAKRGEPRVLFLPETELEEMIQRFRTCSVTVERRGDQLSRLYLGFENKLFENVQASLSIIPISNSSRTNTSLLADALELFVLALGLSHMRAREKFNLSELQWRKFGISVLRFAKSSKFDSSAFASLVKEHFGEEISSSRRRAVDEAFSQLQSVVLAGRRADAWERCSSIHKAKGLEADAVLVVAKYSSELTKWLSTDVAERMSDKQDKCRLGYVAFTRAREMLCLACLRPLDAKTSQLLKLRGVTMAT